MVGQRTHVHQDHLGLGGNMIQALTASQTAVRGAHPTRLLLDEIDEMKLPILEAAQGQPMDRNGVQAQTVMSSTHQYPDGTVTAMRCRAAELGWTIYEWCYRETLEPHGWLTADQVERKRRELSRTMWAVEYELQEPSAEGRAIDPAAVERMFDATLGTHISAGDLEHLWRGQSGPPPSGPVLIRPGRGTAPASTGPRSATTPSPSSCAAIPRRSRSSPRTARSGVHG